MNEIDITFQEYQAEARRFVQWESSQELMVPLLGLAGETGQLLTEYKKWLRDGDRYTPFVDQVSEELGDILWYISALASSSGLGLGDIANENLAKIRDRWGEEKAPRLFEAHGFDDAFPDTEQLPNELNIEFRNVIHEGRCKTVIIVDGEQCGDPLTDNAHAADGYRFHDVFHFAYAVVLGWSPLVRQLLGRKRKSDAQVDEVEDGARAIFLEEGISAMVFEFAKDYAFFDGAATVDFELLKTIRVMTRGLEICSAPHSEWQKAILAGYEAWRPLAKNGEGVLKGCRRSQTLTYSSL